VRNNTSGKTKIWLWFGVVMAINPGNKIRAEGLAIRLLVRARVERGRRFVLPARGVAEMRRIPVPDVRRDWPFCLK
ncbi:MAG: hypothetical protein ACRERV_15145, partial [Methylococcales bacterium]